MRQRKTTQTWPVSASSHTPTFRVLIESADPALALSDFGAYTAAGIDVALCDGAYRALAECPVVRGEPCELAAGADVILFDQGSSGGEVLDATRRRYPGTPVVLRGTDPADAPEGCDVIPANASVEGQISLLRRAAERG
jgi:hypothetical protein